MVDKLVDDYSEGWDKVLPHLKAAFYLRMNICYLLSHYSQDIKIVYVSYNPKGYKENNYYVLVITA